MSCVAVPNHLCVCVGVCLADPEGGIFGVILEWMSRFSESLFYYAGRRHASTRVLAWLMWMLLHSGGGGSRHFLPCFFFFVTTRLAV